MATRRLSSDTEGNLIQFNVFKSALARSAP